MFYFFTRSKTRIEATTFFFPFPFILFHALRSFPLHSKSRRPEGGEDWIACIFKFGLNCLQATKCLFLLCWSFPMLEHTRWLESPMLSMVPISARNAAPSISVRLSWMSFGDMKSEDKEKSEAWEEERGGERETFEASGWFPNDKIVIFESRKQRRQTRCCESSSAGV